MCIFQELQNFTFENVKYSQLKNNKKQKKLLYFIFFLFYCFYLGLHLRKLAN